MKIKFPVIFVRFYIVSIVLLLAACGGDSDSGSDSGSDIGSGDAVSSQNTAQPDPVESTDTLQQTPDLNSVAEQAPATDAIPASEQALVSDANPAPGEELVTDSEQEPVTDSNPEPDDTPPSDAALIINENTYHKILREASSASEQSEIEAVRVEVNSLTTELVTMAIDVAGGGVPIAGLTLSTPTVITGDLMGAGETIEQLYSCSNNGSMELRLERTLAPATTTELSLENCAIWDKTYNGTFVTFSARRANTIDTFTEFEIILGGESQTISGTSELTYVFIGNEEESVWRNVSYKRFREQNEFSVKDFSWRRYGNDTAFPGASDYVSYSVPDREGNIRTIEQYIYEADLTADFVFASPKTDQAEITASIDLSFQKNYFDWAGNSPTYPLTDLSTPLQVSSSSTFDDPATLSFISVAAKVNSPRWRTGQLRLQAPDGSKLLLTPVNNDEGKVLIELNDSGNKIEASWTPAFRIFFPMILR